MRIFLTGATGFIGGHVLRVLADRGHSVTCLARGPGAAGIRAIELPGVTVAPSEFTDPVSYLKHVAGHDIVINTVGIIRDSPRATFDAVHNQAPRALRRRRFMPILSLGIPQLWLHSFGPLTKNVPLIAATLVMRALED